MGRVTLDLENRPKRPVPPPPQDLYAKRRQIYPKLAHGKFRSVKWALMVIALAVYYTLPWVRWDRGEGVPNQAVLADFSSEKFYFFSIEIWPQDIHFLAGLMILAALGLFLVTALLGRVWCGYACPQTVWTDLYIAVERAFEGDRAARMRLDKAPWSVNKLWRKLGKHIVWLVIAFWTGAFFVLYWHDAPTVARGWFTGEAPLSAYWFAALLTFTTYTLAGTMREQVCTYLCPWPRIQGALTDEHALNVTYRYERGEPRAPLRKDVDWSTRGDCIDCDQCVQVCPVGIDIRDGAQLECIHCALCIDACDQMMRKIGRPTGLIAYVTDAAIEAHEQGKPYRYRLFRARTLLYGTLIAAIAGLMVYGYLARATFEVNLLKDRGPAFVRMSDGTVQNGYTLKLVNKESEPRTLTLEIAGVPEATFSIIGHADEAVTAMDLPVAAYGVDRYRLLVRTPSDALKDTQPLSITLTDPANGETHTDRIPFRGPER